MNRFALTVLLVGASAFVTFLGVMSYRQIKLEERLWADCKADGYQDYECYGILRRGR